MRKNMTALKPAKNRLKIDDFTKTNLYKELASKENISEGNQVP